MAGCFTVWRTGLLESRGFPERSLTEDLDFTWQLIGRGYRVLYASEAKCWTIDPQNWPAFRSQLLRWRRGFLQNIAFHWRTWLKSPRMALFVLWWLIGGGLLAPIYLALMFWLMLSQNWLWLGALAGGELAYSGLTALIQGRRLGYSLRVGGYAVYYWILKPVSLYLFWEAVVGELRQLGQGKSRLVWEKTREKGEVAMYQPPGVPVGAMMFRLPILAIITIALLVAPQGVSNRQGVDVVGWAQMKASIAFTFDDGWKSTYERAFPILQSCGAIGTAFIVTSQVGAPAYMNWEQIRRLYEAGWEIASHSATHRQLTQLGEQDLANEIFASKAVLERQGFEVFSFASPFGAYNEEVLELVAQEYAAHRTTETGINYRPIDPYRVLAFDANADGLEDLNKAFELMRRAKQTSGHLVFIFHHIDEAQARFQDYNYPGWKLEALCLYARELGFQSFRIEVARGQP